MLLPAALGAMILASCAPSTPASRIAARPPMFERLPARHQDLVEQGKIDKGMSTDAVYIAWGNASRVYEGNEGGKPTLRWDYGGSAPVYSNGYFGSYGWGGGRFGPYGYYPYGEQIGFGTSIQYVPYRKATVLFENGRVASWEKLR